MSLELKPITFREACAFVESLHRHNKPPRGHKFSIGLVSGDEERLVGVAMVGRPIARAFDDGFTCEVNRTCTDGTRNANSKLYGAAWRAARAMGYRRIITYTQADESGSSLRAAGFVKVAERPARGSWAESSVRLRGTRDPEGPGGVVRILWEIAARGFLRGPLNQREQVEGPKFGSRSVHAPRPATGTSKHDDPDSPSAA